MRRDAIVIKTDEETATVAVLREDACGSCAGRLFCGNARKVEVKAKNGIGAGCGDTVVIETPSSVLLGYTALLFLAPVLLAVILYLVFASVSAVLSYIFAGVGFVLPYIAALLIEKKTRVSLPVICEVKAQSEDETEAVCKEYNDRESSQSEEEKKNKF